MRTIKRYSNRKLYDTTGHQYVTLENVGRLVRQGEDVEVIDEVTKMDVTSSTLAQVLFEEEKRLVIKPLGKSALVKLLRYGYPPSVEALESKG